MDLREKALEGLILEAARSNMGIYAQAVTGGDKPYEKRTERMEGWNEAVMALTKKAMAIEDWLDAVPAEHKTMVEDLLLSDRLQLHVAKDGCSMWVNCSDTFMWGCSDAEDITLEELPALAECYALVPSHGGELWCARKRGMRPQGASYNECYPRESWHLFDQCGPARTAGLGDPVDREKLDHKATQLERRKVS